MAGVLEMAWRSGRSTHEGYAEFKMTVYWRRGGMRGGTGDRMVGVRGGTGEPYCGGATGLHGVLGCSSDPSNNSGGAWGYPLAPLTN